MDRGDHVINHKKGRDVRPAEPLVLGGFGGLPTKPHTFDMSPLERISFLRTT